MRESQERKRLRSAEAPLPALLGGEPPKPVEVVFLEEVDHARMVPVKRGIADDSYVEIVEGLKEGQEVVSGGYKAISRELEDSKKIRKGKPEGDKEKEKK